MSYVLVQYAFIHDMRGTGDRVVWVCSIRYCCIGRSGQTPFGVEHNFFQKSSIRFRQYAGIRSDREFRGYNMYRIICGRAVLEAELGYPVLPMVYPKAINCNIGRVSPVEGC